MKTLNNSKLYSGVSLCFFISGISALIFQVIWIRLFSLIFGTTQFAIGTVIAGFLGGLGLGSWLISRSKKQYHPLKLYAYLEIFIGLYGLSFFWLCSGLIPLQQFLLNTFPSDFYTLSLLRLILALLLLLPPTIAMGATLPILSQFCQEKLSSPILGISFLYAFNTLGASLGALLSGLILIPLLGQFQTNLIAVSFNFIIGIVVLCFSYGFGSKFVSLKEEIKKPLTPIKPSKLLLFTVVFSSVITLLLELIWSRTLEMILGSSVYMISSILTVFIFGLGLGSLLSAILFVPRTQPLFWIGVAFLLAASALWGSLYLLTELPLWLVLIFHSSIAPLKLKFASFSSSSYGFMAISFLFCCILIGKIIYQVSPFSQMKEKTPKNFYLFYFLGVAFFAGIFLLGLFFTLKELISSATVSKVGEHFQFFFLIKFSMVSLMMLPPCIFLGMIFPLSLSALERKEEASLKSQIGQLYAFSTLGCILGSLMGGFLAIPFLGVYPSFIAIIVASYLFGFYQILQKRRKPQKQIIICGMLFTSFGLFLFPPPFHYHLLASGINQYIHRLQPKSVKGLRKDFDRLRDTILSHQDGVTATITITETADNRSLKINGKADASTKKDMYTQVLVGQIPLFLTQQNKDILVVGYGSGMTLGSVLTHPGIEKAIVLEIERKVIAAASYFQPAILAEPLKNPKVQLKLDDARNYLLLHPQEYDIIISEPSNPWMTGASKLFTQEFFQLAKQRLKKDGTLACWIQLYGMDQDSLFILFNTIQSIFPETYLFKIHSDLLLLCRNQPLKLTAKLLNQRFSPKVNRDLQRLNICSLADLMQYFVLGPKGFLQLTPKHYQVEETLSPLKRDDILVSFDHQPIPPLAEWKTWRKKKNLTLLLQRNNQLLQQSIPGSLLEKLKYKRVSPLLNTDDLPVIEYKAPKNIFSKDQQLLEKWLNSIPGVENLPQFIQWSSSQEKQQFQKELFTHYLLQNQTAKIKAMIQENANKPETLLFSKRLTQKSDFFWGKGILNALPPLRESAINDVEEALFSYAVKSKQPVFFYFSLKSWKKHGQINWKKNKKICEGFSSFLEEDYQKSVFLWEQWEHNKASISPPLEYYLLKGIALENIKKTKAAEKSYHQFCVALLDELLPYYEFENYLNYLKNTTKILRVQQNCNAILRCLQQVEQAVQMVQKKDFSSSFELFKQSLVQFPQSSYIFYHFWLTLGEEEENLFLEKNVQKTMLANLKNVFLLKNLAFYFKTKGQQKDPKFLRVAQKFYQKALKQKIDFWERREIQFCLELTQKLLDKE